MTGHEGFIQAISDDPVSEIHRLVYADWLEEHDASPAADYLRTELELARLPPNSPDAPALRTRLWQAWATVDPAWRMTFTQPGMLRANPTPFPSAWINFGLGTLRNRQGTYGGWAYDSLPRLQLEEMRGEFQYLTASRTLPESHASQDLQRHRQAYERMLAEAASKAVDLPEAFVNFMKNPSLHNTFRSVTDCFFTFPREYTAIRPNPLDAGVHVHFYSDSQSCVLWDLYVHPSGAHCVIARDLDFFEPEQPAPENDEPRNSGPRAWFVAPSFEAFVFRVWLENQVWYIDHARGGDPRPPITPPIQAYMDHYRKQQT